MLEHIYERNMQDLLTVYEYTNYLCVYLPRE